MRHDPVPWVIAATLAVGLLAAPWGQMREGRTRPEQQVGDVLGGGGAGFARVTGPRPFEFPQDHGPHPDHRSEWWYITGNVTDQRGRAYGFQFTLFRFALAPNMPSRESAWATRQAWMGHFALTDVASGQHVASERLQRGALGLAGVETRPFRAWLDDWSLASLPAAGEGGLFPLRLETAIDGSAVELTLRAAKPKVLQGKAGYSQKGAEPDNASHYYSYTRLEAEGRLRTADAWRDVTGSAWLDREWSTSALADDQAGWDWLALQLDDGRDVMVYRLRRDDGTTDPASYGVVVGPDGAADKLGAADFELIPKRYWKSPTTGTRYPVSWWLRVPSASIDASVTARVDDQLMDFGFRYWEGSVAVQGVGARPPIEGVGYLEMTGY